MTTVFARLSILLIVATAATALVATGLAAFGASAIDPSVSKVHAVFKALPPEVAFGAPLLAAATVIAAFLILRVLGWLIVACTTAVFVAAFIAASNDQALRAFVAWMGG